MTKNRQVPNWQRAIILLSSTVVSVVIVLSLWWGRPVLIPIALAVLLTFLLNPLVRRLERRGLKRTFAVMIAVIMAGSVVMGVSWMATRQIASLLAELPQNSANLAAKAKALRQLGSNPFVSRFEQMFEDINEELHPELKENHSSRPADETPDASFMPPEKVIIRAESASWQNLTGYLNSAFEVFVTLAFALVLLVFFLLGREDLRDRTVLLAGRARLALTSKALEDATDRISRYIVMVALVNGGFGTVLTAGLLLLQVPYALLWGFVAAALRFIPYIGPWVGALFPIVMSLAASEGWSQPCAVFFFVLALELICNNVVEPLAFGHSTGVSPMALLISAAFWLYLWGPIGLVLSAPIAVCLVVLGKNIPQLSFLNLLLGEAPAMRADVSLYQRLMSGDQLEAATMVVQRLKNHPAAEVYDELLIPALTYAKRDVGRDYLTVHDQRNMLEGVTESLQQAEGYLQKILASKDDSSETSISDPSSIALTVLKPIKILGCPAMDETDSLGLEMLRQLLNPQIWDLEATAVITLTSELVDRLIKDPPAVVCIAALPPSGLAHARYLCKRLREASPEMQIVVGRWGQKRNFKLERERLLQTGADFVTATLVETLKLLDSRLPLLPRERLTAAAGVR